MSQLQFRSDDTIKWLEGYGNRSAGDITLTTLGGVANTTFTGTEDAFTGTVGSNSGFSIGDIVGIFQSREGGDGGGVWQLNKITNIVGTTFTFKYKLTHDYATTAQIIRVPQYKNITINAGITPAYWDGTKGGIAFLMGDKLLGSGSIVNSGADGWGYTGAGQNGGAYGQGGFWGGNADQAQLPGGSSTNSQNGEWGGGARGTGNSGSAGGGAHTSGSDDHSVSGGGGGHGAAGSEGTTGTGGGHVDGPGGSTSTDSADLITILFGAGGGGGTDHWNDPQNHSVGGGGQGGGIVILIIRQIDISSFSAVAVNGGGGGSAGASGGGGAGGSILIKCQTAVLGTNILQANGGGGPGGGNAGKGRIHIDYLTSYTGSAAAGIDYRQDSTLIDPGGAFLGLI